MPFTAAHPMAVLPLWPARHRLHLDATCLVTGSIAPDFAYFVQGDQLRIFSHSLVGLFAWGIPAALVLALAWHLLVKRPLLLVAPVAIARRLVDGVSTPWPARWSPGVLASCIVSATIGAATHLGWDTFTHAHAWGVHRVPWLGRTITVPVLGHTSRFHVLQYVSTIVGMTVVAIFVARAIWRRPRSESCPSPDWPARIVYVTALAVGTVTACLVRRGWHRDFETRVGVLVSGLLAGIVLASVVLLRRSLRTTVRSELSEGESRISEQPAR
jgi:hypothetical protein